MTSNAEDIASALRAMPANVRGVLRKRAKAVVKQYFADPLEASDIIPESKPTTQYRGRRPLRSPDWYLDPDTDKAAYKRFDSPGYRGAYAGRRRRYTKGKPKVAPQLPYNPSTRGLAWSQAGPRGTVQWLPRASLKDIVTVIAPLRYSKTARYINLGGVQVGGKGARHASFIVGKGAKKLGIRDFREVAVDRYSPRLVAALDTEVSKFIQTAFQKGIIERRLEIGKSAFGRGRAYSDYRSAGRRVGEYFNFDEIRFSRRNRGGFR